jgi:hypothetical protein
MRREGVQKKSTVTFFASLSSEIIPLAIEEDSIVYIVSIMLYCHSVIEIYLRARKRKQRDWKNTNNFKERRK